MISTENLTKRYPGEVKDALHEVSFTIEKGSFFGLLGPNGSGKTTCISILCGLLQASSGSVKIAGLSVEKELRRIQALIGLVPQKIALYPSLTLTENLKLFASLYGLTSSQAKQRIDICLELVDLKDARDKIISQFSGGMARRANLAAGLLHNPEVLFLDEPTANVDAHTRHMIFQNLQQLNQQGVTIIYTSHYLEEIELLCSHVGILNQGEMIISDTLKNIQGDGHKSLSDIYLSLTEK